MVASFLPTAGVYLYQGTLAREDIELALERRPAFGHFTRSQPLCARSKREMRPGGDSASRVVRLYIGLFQLKWLWPTSKMSRILGGRQYALAPKRSSSPRSGLLARLVHRWFNFWIARNRPSSRLLLMVQRN